MSNAKSVTRRTATKRLGHGPAPECPIRGEIEARLDSICGKIDEHYKLQEASQARTQKSLEALNTAVMGDGETLGLRGRLLLVQSTVKTWKRSVWLIAAAVVTLFTEQVVGFFTKK